MTSIHNVFNLIHLFPKYLINIDITLLLSVQGENRSLGFEPHFRNTCIDTADAIVVMYSVTDRNSFHLARETLDWLAMEFTSDNKTSECGGFSFDASSMESKLWHPPITCPVLLLANKSDLSHLRKVINIEL